MCIKKRSLLSLYNLYNSGFLLIELLVALLLLSISFLLIVGYQSRIIDIQRQAIKRMQAVDYAASFLEQLITGEKTITASGKQKSGDFSLEWHIFPQACPAVNIKQFVWVDVHVKWPNRVGSAHVIQLQTGLIRPLTRNTHHA